MQIGIPVGFTMLAVGEAMQPIAPNMGTLTQYGALGVLAWVAWTQRLELQAFRKKLDFWENVRHTDSDKLNDTLRDMSAQIATVNAQRKT